MSSILVNNERPGVLDLSGVQDVDGLPVVLQPKGTPGDTRECPTEALDNPHLVRVHEVGWVSVRPTAAKVAVKVTVVEAPPVPPAPPAPEPEPEPEPITEAKLEELAPLPEPEPEPPKAVETPRSSKRGRRK